MNQLTIKNRTFMKNGKPYFLLADTCWSAFTNIELEDWKYYVQYRCNQGFNTIQVNVLPQWDASEPAFKIDPFGRNEDGTFQFGKVNENYFDRAEEMVKYASSQGVTCALVLLWVNYLPNTWATNLRKTHHFPLDYVEEYVELVVGRFSKYNPMYLVSGDTDFPEEVVPYFDRALKKVKELDPKGLATLHIRGRQLEIPKMLEEHPDLDFYMYQSGHNSEFQAMAYTLAKDFYETKPEKPIINGEPCYEMMGYSRRVYGRFTRFDVRKVAWQSVLSGAGAGVTYGAHGIWSWHRQGSGFGMSLGEAFDAPYDWRSALMFEGGWDYAFIKSFIETHQLFDLQPSSILINNTEEIRVSQQEGQVIIYVPFNTTIKLKGDFSSYKLQIIELETKKVSTSSMTFKDENTIIGMHQFIGDTIYHLTK